MMGLDMTHQTIVTEENYPAFSQLNGPVATAVQDMLEHSFSPDVQAITGLNGKIIHDPHTIAYLLKPDLYEGRHVHVEIDISTTIMAGRSTVDWFGKRALTPNAYVVNRDDVGGFFELLTDQLRQYDTDEQRHTACIR